MKKLSLFLALAMLLSCISLPVALAEEPAATIDDRLTSYDQVNSLIRIIPAEGDQVELGYLEGYTNILEVDGLKFKDMNDNGELDVYEDWRQDVDARVNDLYSQLDIEEKSGLFYHINTCNNPQGVDFADDKLMFGTDEELGIAKEEAPAEEAPAAEGESGGGPGGGGGSFSSSSMWYCLTVLKVTSQLDNTNGTPDQQIVYHNAMQAIAENTRLGIPVVISNDREYNAWGGMIDTAHDAFGAANDLELSEKLWTIYSLESRVTGIHVVLHPYGQELGSWNGEDPYYAGTQTRAEVNALQVEGGVEACMKHFIARGGDSSFQNARSDAQTVDNWMKAWEIALEANPKWVMTNGYGTGLTNTVHVDYDKETMDYLRKTLGFEGIIVSDWGDQGDSNSSGTTTDGVTILDLTMAERYAWVINLGMDQIGAFATGYNEDGHGGASSRQAIIDALEQGLITEDRAYETCYRVLKDKFELGLFENPYSDVDKALALAASEAYIAERFAVVDTETLMAARNPEVVELERQLQAESAILFKNDDNLLPLEKGIKLYIDSTASAITLEGYKKVLPDFCELVDEIEDADVVVADCTQNNDAAELVIEDAKDEGKKLVIVSNCIDPDAYFLTMGDAVLGLTFSRAADHGTGAGGFITTTEPIMLAKLLFGDAEPQGMVVKELSRDSAMNDAQFKDLAGDQGVDTWVRLMLLGTMKADENKSVPNNWSDALVQYKYGMRYGEQPDFAYEALILPRVTKEVEVESSGSTSINYESAVEAKAGVPFTVYCLMWNNGADGMTIVQALVDGEVNAEKIMAVNSGDWRVLKMDVTIDQPGEHTITVGTITKTINIAE
ncbi:MAG: glycoside hydrolase family 3 protein [Clostridia bacterium]|nr:glycoside hydrolase family 3 protein [Clostridia bacterium]